MRRHDLAWLTRRGWAAALSSHPELADDLLLRQWMANGWPLVRRRPFAGDRPGIPLGLPPPFDGATAWRTASRPGQPPSWNSVRDAPSRG